MARRNDRISCYYWWDKEKEKRVSWFFPSRKAANKWRDDECRFYVDYGTPEEVIKAFHGRNPNNMARHWRSNKEKYHKLEMKRAVILYDVRFKGTQYRQYRTNDNHKKPKRVEKDYEYPKSGGGLYEGQR